MGLEREGEGIETDRGGDGGRVEIGSEASEGS